jgi:hypothetical protein
MIVVLNVWTALMKWSRYISQYNQEGIRVALMSVTDLVTEKILKWRLKVL